MKPLDLSRIRKFSNMKLLIAFMMIFQTVFTMSSISSDEYYEFVEDLTTGFKLLVQKSEEKYVIKSVSNFMAVLCSSAINSLQKYDKTYSTIQKRLEIIKKRPKKEKKEMEITIETEFQEYFENELDSVLLDKYVLEENFLNKTKSKLEELQLLLSSFLIKQHSIVTEIIELGIERNVAIAEEERQENELNDILDNTISDKLAEMASDGVNLEPWRPTEKDIEEMEQRRLQTLYITTRVESPNVLAVRENIKNANMTISEFCVNSALIHKLSYVVEDCVMKLNYTCLEATTNLTSLFKMRTVQKILMPESENDFMY